MCGELEVLTENRRCVCKGTQMFDDSNHDADHAVLRYQGNSFPVMEHIHNIEIKARSANHEKIRDFLKSHGADFKGIDNQIDTYFKVNKGRLKLREGTIENHLIYYGIGDKYTYL